MTGPGVEGSTAQPSWAERELARCTSTTVALADLLPADSPRGEGEADDHVAELSELDPDTVPAIVVHEHTMRVVDGMHRLRAAEARGLSTVAVRLYPGDARDAFVLAIRLNSAHGLPLTRADRRGAAERVVASHPEWSDRMIAATSGLSASTVAAARRCATDRITQSDKRVGADGRRRPVDGGRARREVAARIAERPEASLRAIARETGVSPSTVRSVREELSRPAASQDADGNDTGNDTAQDDVPPNEAARTGAAEARGVRRPASLAVVQEEGGGHAVSRPSAPAARAALGGHRVERLKRDPSLRMNERSRALLRWLDAQRGLVTGDLCDTVPPHCAQTVALALRDAATTACEMAARLEAAGTTTTSLPPSA